jgi:phage terminase large subunit-like protein
MSPTPGVNKGNKYARDVVAGKIDVCRYVKLACKRHLDDLEKAKQKGYEYEFDREKAEKVIRFIQKLPHTKNEWALRKELLVLEPWQCLFVMVMFGWVNKKTGYRKYRKAVLFTPRKCGKSLLAAAIGHYMFCADGEFGAEVYSGATTEKQAWEVFTPAKLMAERTDDFRAYYGIHVGAKNMFRLEDGSKFEPVVGQPGDGASPSCAITDEYHEHTTSAQADTFVTGMVGRRQPIWLVVTTAGVDIEGPCFDLWNDCVEVM